MRSVASVYGNKRTRGQGRTGEFPRLLSGRLCLDFANTIEGFVVTSGLPEWLLTVWWILVCI